jgi:hypothetical protein
MLDPFAAQLMSSALLPSSPVHPDLAARGNLSLDELVA